MPVSTDKFDSMVTFVILLGILAVIELIIGIVRGNLEVIKDFILSTLMIASIVFSMKMSYMSRRKSSDQFNYGFRRLNILAAFVITAQILCQTFYTFVETMRYMIGDWEEELQE